MIETISPAATARSTSWTALECAVEDARASRRREGARVIAAPHAQDRPPSPAHRRAPLSGAPSQMIAPPCSTASRRRDAPQGMDDVLDPDDRRPCAWTAEMMASRSSHSASVRPPAISSSSRSAGLAATALASSSRLRSSSESVPAGWARERARPVRRQHLVAPRARPAGIVRPPPWVAATSTFSNTLICAKGFGTW